MRPARDSCEKCHFPEKFSDDSLREIRHYTGDETNSFETIYLVMKTGGGSKREGLGRGIHWHIENEVWYLSTDELAQDIPYVRVIEDDGQVVEYYDVASGNTPDDIAGKYLERMDCISCHNRITHESPQPYEAVDQALKKGLLSVELPGVQAQAVELLSVDYPDQETAFEAFEQLDTFYKEQYPQVYSENIEDVQEAVETVAEIYTQNIFIDQKVNWDTHPSNMGHITSPGCFRCHDGKHLTQTGDAIRLECNICHSVPVLSAAGTLTTDIEIVQGPEPVSHTHTSWMTLHGRSIDSSCSSCHPPVDPETDYTKLETKPTLDDSFCGNQVCHGFDLKYTGFDSPALAPFLEDQLYTLLNTSPYLIEGAPLTYDDMLRDLFEGRCGSCHNELDNKAGLNLSTYESILHGGISGPGVVPGDPSKSSVILRQSTQSAHFGQMLSDELEVLRSWILAGAPEN
jgi:hypothetical protein